MPWLRWLVSDSLRSTRSSSSRERPANRLSPSCTASHPPGSSAVVAIAPAFTMGFIGLPWFSSSAITELKGSPVLLTPTTRCTASCPIASSTSASTKALEIDWIVKGAAVSPARWVVPSASTRARPNRAGSASARAGM